jgi:uncharacterized membrane protein
MTKARLEAFSDGVIAIIVTIMVLELKAPKESSWSALIELKSTFISYIISFVGVAIYWVNHHHLIQAISKVSSAILWANMFLLFCLSLVPFVTAWMGESEFSKNTIAAYALLCNLCGLAYFLLLLAIKKSHLQQSHTLKLIQYQSRKGLISAAIYFLSLLSAFFYPIISIAIFILVALMWVIPDKNIEAQLSTK